ncbi:hypothetical protein B0H16DRAFT_742342 [Mycena metata]|uniref:Serine-threonine/tyrosine-protein kinase catalytic domain-containing protein n=1 Tax=Mycena metata TaxID=1033252 RepID=A0AAD7DY96_9AGAR|nr:hypothetical protein B0H16DRAFT_742342 [Mycena metata]
MAFISNASNFTLGDGVYTNVQGNIVHNNFYGTKRRRDEIEDGSDVLLLRDRPDKRPRLEEEGAASGLKVIRQQNLQLIRQIGSGPGYLLHAARNKARAVTVKVFNSSDPSARQQLEAAVTLCKKLMHPNVLRMKGISSLTSLSQFIVYEDVPRKNAKGPLATALQNRTRSLQLGFKMVADLSAGMDYLSRQGISLAVMRAENFDVFLDVDDRFLIIINANSSDIGDVPHSYGSQEDNSWALFNSLCDKILVSANRVLHTEEIDRDPVLLPSTSPPSQKSDSSLIFIGSPSSPDQQDDAGGHASSVGDPRREYVWRAMDRGKQSLATVTEHMTTHLDLAPARLQRLTQTDGRRAHRCRGYMREEITLAPTIVDSAVISHDTPRPLEICSICHEIVGWDEVFRCICGDSGPGSRYTVKCTLCKFWSHRDCTGNVQLDFTCRFCEGSGDLESSFSDSPPTPTLSLSPSTPPLALMTPTFNSTSEHETLHPDPGPSTISSAAKRRKNSAPAAQAVEFVVATPRQRSRTASAPTPPPYWQTIQIPNVYLPASGSGSFSVDADADASLMPILVRHGVGNGNGGFDYMPSFSGTYDSESSNFLRSMFSATISPTSPPSSTSGSGPSSPYTPAISSFHPSAFSPSSYASPTLDAAYPPAGDMGLGLESAGMDADGHYVSYASAWAASSPRASAPTAGFADGDFDIGRIPDIEWDLGRTAFPAASGGTHMEMGYDDMMAGRGF